MAKRKKHAGGRPDELTPAVQDRLIQATQGGNTRRASAEYAGINRATLSRWLARGRKEESGKFHDLCSAIKKAESEAEVRNVAIIQTAAKKNWTAAAWWLERRRHEAWGRKDSVNHKHKGKISLGVEVEEIVVKRREELDTEAEG